MKRIDVVAFALGLSSATVAPLTAQPSAAPKCVNDSTWVQPQAPFRIYGNTWHVGPRGLGVFLITSRSGHVLIDGGIAGHASQITDNIRRLGFSVQDVRWILNTHAHCDHAGGFAELLRETGAQLIAGVADSAILQDGGRGDPHYGDRYRFPGVSTTRTITRVERLRLGAVTITAHPTPGHTRGNTTWSWSSCEGTRCYTLVDVGSLSAPGYQLVGNARHPTLEADYRRSFAVPAALLCDIALAPHPGMVDFWERMARRDAGIASALVDRSRCRRYAETARAEFQQELARQQRASGGR
jgi:metallo-beta-lactamase class B